MEFYIAHVLKEALETENPTDHRLWFADFAGQGLLAQCVLEPQPQTRSETNTDLERHPTGSSTHEEPSESACHQIDSRLKYRDGYLCSERSSCAKTLS